jgi:hypothetical protein
MQPQFPTQERPWRSTICLFAPRSLKAVDRIAARLQQWAEASEVPLAGRPFLRLHADTSMVVHIPTAVQVDPHPETGIIPGAMRAGRVVAVPAIPFEAFVEASEELRRRIEPFVELGGPVEFHAAEQGFACGTILFPVAKAIAIPETFRDEAEPIAGA